MAPRAGSRFRASHSGGRVKHDPRRIEPGERAAPTGSGKHHKRLASDFSDNRLSARDIQAPSSDRAVREARRQLNLEFLHECAGGIAVHAGLVQTFAEIGDTAGACYALKRLFAHARAAHPIYLELRDGADGGAEP
jgi:hypothetical protein